MNLIACAQIGGPTWEMFDERLVWMRENKGLTQAELARWIGVTRTTVCDEEQRR